MESLMREMTACGFDGQGYVRSHGMMEFGFDPSARIYDV